MNKKEYWEERKEDKYIMERMIDDTHDHWIYGTYRLFNKFININNRFK